MPWLSCHFLIYPISEAIPPQQRVHTGWCWRRFPAAGPFGAARVPSAGAGLVTLPQRCQACFGGMGCSPPSPKTPPLAGVEGAHGNAAPGAWWVRSWLISSCPAGTGSGTWHAVVADSRVWGECVLSRVLPWGETPCCDHADPWEAFGHWHPEI